MSKNKADRKDANPKAPGCDTASSSCSFEGKFISIAGSRLEVENEHDKKTSYALASDALLTCDGKVSKEESLKSGKRIRVTTQKGNPNMVTGIEWLTGAGRFPELKTTTK